MHNDVPIYFYIHPHFWPQGDIPDSADVPWAGFAFGIYAWTIQTYLRLKESGFECELVSVLPERGILFAHRDCLSSEEGIYNEKIYPTKQLFIVDMCADLPLYSYANLHISQNPHQARTTSKCFSVPHWTQPGLIPRDKGREERFENIYFFGNEKYLPPELRTEAWVSELRKMGLNWKGQMQTFFFDKPDSYLKINNWCDYSDVDAVVAVRRFQSSKKAKYNHKPATKLYNSWLAGVPAILGIESAYQNERVNELDYIEVCTLEETLSALQRLKNDYELRSAMSSNGFMRSQKILPAATLEVWKKLITEQIIPEYRRWLAKPGWLQRIGIVFHKITLFKDFLKQKLLYILGPQ